MKCRDCKFLGEPQEQREAPYPWVRCTLGIWDKDSIPQWHSYGESQLNRGPVKRYGASCTRGELKKPY